MHFAEFVNDEDKRRRYWAQSFAGWHRISNAKPNAAHHAIVELERYGYVSCVITQNVDNLHTAAGSRNVIDLHGVLQQIRCLDCNTKDSRYAYQGRLQDCNPDWSTSITAFAPDGDARISVDDVRSFDVPGCLNCGGIIKPDVVFFGENVPALRVDRCFESLAAADAMLIVGSSLVVYSGFRFARKAQQQGLPIVAINLGKTRTDGLITLKIEQDCADLLPRVISQIRQNCRNQANA